MDDPSPSEFQVGTLLAEKFRVERVLGRGGMGVVVAATHLRLGQTVALKLLRSDRTTDETTKSRFLREARAAAAIESEHVVRVHDVGFLEDGTPYIVMEYLAGTDMAGEAVRGQPVEQVVDWVLQACEAVAEAHVRGIIHRDLKPGNLFLCDRVSGEAVVKVLDFGVAKALEPHLDDEEALQTQTLAVMGTPRYMSPEQMRSAKHVDARTDIWAVGAIAFELLAGRPAFEGESLADLCAKVATEPVTPLHTLRPDVPKELERVIAQCMEKDRQKRPATVAHLAASLAPFGSDAARASAARIERIMGARAPAESTATVHGVETPEAATGSRRRPRALAPVLLVLLVVGFGTLYWISGPSDEPTTAVPAVSAVAGTGSAIGDEASADPSPQLDAGAVTADAAGAGGHSPGAGQTPSPLDVPAPSTSARPNGKVPSPPPTPASTRPPVRGNPGRGNELDEEPLLDRE